MTPYVSVYREKIWEINGHRRLAHVGMPLQTVASAVFLCYARMGQLTLEYESPRSRKALKNACFIISSHVLSFRSRSLRRPLLDVV